MNFLLIVLAASLSLTGALIVKDTKALCTTVPSNAITFPDNYGETVCCPDGYSRRTQHGHGQPPVSWCYDGGPQCTLFKDPSITEEYGPDCDAVSAAPDPHMTNLAGDRFDVLRPGTYTLIELPRGAPPGSHRLFVSARIDQMLDQCQKNGLYVQDLNVSGSLLRDVLGPFAFNVVPRQAALQNVLHVRTERMGATDSKTFAQAKVNGMWKFTQPNPNRQNLKLKLGAVGIHIAARRQELTSRGLDIHFIDLKVTGLKRFKDVGGMLGHDDHSWAATSPTECGTAALLRSNSTSDAYSDDMGSRLMAN